VFCCDLGDGISEFTIDRLIPSPTVGQEVTIEDDVFKDDLGDYRTFVVDEVHLKTDADCAVRLWVGMRLMWPGRTSDP